VSGVSVTHCTLKDTMFGVRIKTWEGSEPSKASDITFEDVGMTDVGTAIVINQKYGALSNSVCNTHTYIYELISYYFC
jgi:galacturan 1,4-alpha-galacturonidase